MAHLRPVVVKASTTGESRLAHRGMFIFAAVASSTTPVVGRFANDWNRVIAALVAASSFPALAPDTRPATAAASSPSPSGSCGAPKSTWSGASR